VLILDDATSSVDASTEQSIKLALAQAMSGRTTFIIAHRPSTIALADEIVVLDHGRIVAQGDHSEVFETSEFYRELLARGMSEADRDDQKAGRERRPRREPAVSRL
jgi:ATP-binding cassette subfamily B protein